MVFLNLVSFEQFMKYVVSHFFSLIIKKQK